MWWKCLCDCGKIKIVRGSSLRGEVIRSCGCLRNEANTKRLWKHGQAGIYQKGKGCIRKQTKEYNAWCDAKHRIDNPKNKRYEKYKDKKMCAGFRSGFNIFWAIVGPCPDKSLSLHRIDNEGHYSCGQCDECKANGWPMNCKWGTDQEQANAKSTNRYLTFNGKTQTIAQWAREWNTQASYIYTRLYRGWTDEQIFSYFSVDGKQSTPNVTTV